MRILGIDPGSLICGYGVVDLDGSRISLVEFGVINVKKFGPSIPARLKEIYQRLQRIMIGCEPDCAAFEATFYSKNPQSLIKLAHARAAAVLACAVIDLPIAEYSPKEVKKAVAGNGNATKEQVQYMAQKLLKINVTPEFYDATDALAVALCHAFRHNLPSGGATGGWAEFVKNNPDRIVKN